jgi:hypothetical protein
MRRNALTLNTIKVFIYKTLDRLFFIPHSLVTGSLLVPSFNQNTRLRHAPQNFTTTMSQPSSMQYTSQQPTSEGGEIPSGDQQFAAWKLDEERERKDDKDSGLCADCLHDWCGFWACLGWFAR